MRPIGKTASILLICVGVFVAAFASPALAAKRGNAADFAGVWETEIPDVNARYRLTLRVEGNNVDGEFVNLQDPRYNGTIGGVVDPSLDGTAKGGRFDFYCYQPKVKTGCTGYFIVGVDNTIAGFTMMDGDATRKQYGWEGKRKLGTASTTQTPEPTKKGVKVVADVTGYDAPGGGDRCYLSPGDTAALLGVDDGDPTWKHLQGTGSCDGQDFWVYDEGQLQEL